MMEPQAQKRGSVSPCTQLLKPNTVLSAHRRHVSTRVDSSATSSTRNKFRYATIFQSKRQTLFSRKSPLLLLFVVLALTRQLWLLTSLNNNSEFTKPTSDHQPASELHKWPSVTGEESWQWTVLRHVCLSTTAGGGMAVHFFTSQKQMQHDEETSSPPIHNSSTVRLLGKDAFDAFKETSFRYHNGKTFQESNVTKLLHNNHTILTTSDEWTFIPGWSLLRFPDDMMHNTFHVFDNHLLTTIKAKQWIQQQQNATVLPSLTLLMMAHHVNIARAYPGWTALINESARVWELLPEALAPQAVRYPLEDHLPICVEKLVWNPHSPYPYSGTMVGRYGPNNYWKGVALALRDVVYQSLGVTPTQKSLKKPRLTWASRNDTSSTRKLLNEAAVLDQFKQHFDVQVLQFKQSDPRDHASLIRLVQLLADTDILMGLHGAALTHAALIPEGGMLVELKTHFGAKTRFFVNVASHSRLPYYAFDVRPFSVQQSRRKEGVTLPEHAVDTLIKGVLEGYRHEQSRTRAEREEATGECEFPANLQGNVSAPQYSQCYLVHSRKRQDEWMQDRLGFN